MDLKDYDEVTEQLVLPIRGKRYTLPPVSFGDGEKITLALAGERELSNTELRDIVLGPLVPQFRADNVPAEAVGRALAAGIALFQRGPVAAAALWETGIDPKVVALWTAEQQKNSTSTNTGEANTTPKQASGNGTKTSRQASAAQAAQK